jgi:hypothetical protein
VCLGPRSEHWRRPHAAAATALPSHALLQPRSTALYIHTYIHTYIQTCIHTHIHTYIPVEPKRSSAFTSDFPSLREGFVYCRVWSSGTRNRYNFINTRSSGTRNRYNFIQGRQVPEIDTISYKVVRYQKSIQFHNLSYKVVRYQGGRVRVSTEVEYPLLRACSSSAVLRAARLHTHVRTHRTSSDPA